AAGEVDLGPVDDPAAEVAERAVEGDLATGEDADAKRVLPARVVDDHFPDAFLVEQSPQLEVDRARRQLLGVEAGDAVFDLGRARRLGVRLGQPARVIGDRSLAYSCHTNTSRSKGS